MKTAAEQRSEKRQYRIECAKRDGVSIVNRLFPDPSQCPTEQTFNFKWKELLDVLEHLSSTPQEFRIAHNSAVSMIIKYQEEFGWTLSPPSYFIREKGKTQLLTKKWFAQAWPIRAIYDEWMTHLNDPSYLSTNEQKFQSILLSLIFHSGQSQYIVIMETAKLLIHGELSIQQWSSNPYYVVDIDSTHYSTNAIVDKKHITQYVSYLHPFTLALLCDWRKYEEKNIVPIANERDLFKRLTSGLNSAAALTNKSLRLFCSRAMFTTTSLPGLKLNHALCCVQSGETLTYSLPSSNLHRLVHPAVKPIHVRNYSDLTSNIFSSKPNQNRAHNSSINFIVRLRKSMKNTSTSKLTQEKLKKQLQTFRHSNDWALHEKALVDWLIFKCATCGSSTILRYFSSFAKTWLLANHEISLMDADRESLEETYSKMCESKIKGQHYFLGRLQDFHSFLVRQYKVPAVSRHIFEYDKNRAHVRSGFVDEGLFLGLLNTIQQFKDLSPLEKQSLQCICLVLYRGGLRPSEARKLQIKHLEDSKVGWLQIRENKYGDNKSSSSRRKIPLYRLLLPEELKLMQAYLLARKTSIRSENRSMLLFPFRNGEKPFLDLDVSSIISLILRKLSGLDYLTTYHLRHSCLSKMHLLAEISDHLDEYPNICAYNQEQRKQIQDTIFGATNKQYRYYSIATFAGHSSPEVTFNSYFHFSDWIIALKLRERSIPLTLKQAMNAKIASRRLYKSIPDQPVINDFTDYINKKANIPTVKAIITRRVKPEPLLTESDQKIDISVCRQIIENHQLGHDIELLSHRHHINTKTLERWIKNAQFLKKMTTYSHKENSRLISSERAESLVPAALHTHKEQQMAERFLSDFKKTNKKKRRAIMGQLEVALRRVSTSRSGIYFNSPKDLSTFISTMSFAIKKSQWRAVTNYHGSSKESKTWERALQNIQTFDGAVSSEKGRSGHGAVLLQLRHPNEKALLEKIPSNQKHSSNALIYIAHMMAIMMLNTE